MTQISQRWRPIEDLPGDAGTLASSELRALADVWLDQKTQLDTSDSLAVFTERLQRKWAIETGIIERVYSLDRGITQLLIEHGIDASLIPEEATDKDPNLVARMIHAHEDVVEGLFAFVRGDRALTVGYIKELHAALTREQATTAAMDQFGRPVEVPLVHGEYKSVPNNPTRTDGSVHEYCPPEQVASEMDRLVSLHDEHEREGIAPEVEAAWLHHRFTQIHPFQDGNGRVARALASLVFIKAGWFPLVVDRDDRLRYIDALEAADDGYLRPLVEMFAAIQKRAFVGALSEVGTVLQRRQVGQVIAATADLFERRQRELWAEWRHALEVANELRLVAWKRFDDVAGQLRTEIGRYNDAYRFRADTEGFDGDRDHYFYRQIVHAAKELDYFANTSAGYRAWARLILTTETTAEVLLSLHGIGHEFRGVLGASLSFFRTAQNEEGEREIVDLCAVVDDVFQINYRDDVLETTDRFEQWLDQGLVRGLEVWRSGL